MSIVDAPNTVAVFGTWLKDNPLAFWPLTAISAFFVVMGVLALLAKRWPDRFHGIYAWMDDHTLGPLFEWFLRRRFEREVKSTGDSPGRVALRRLILMLNLRVAYGDSPQEAWDALMKSQRKVADEMGPVPHLYEVQKILHNEFSGECEARGLIPPVFVAPENSQST